MIESPHFSTAGQRTGGDVLSELLRAIRLSGSVQFCFVSSGAWQTDAAPSLAKLAKRFAASMPFHIVVEGTCWLRMDGAEALLEAGDIVAFPFGAGH